MATAYGQRPSGFLHLETEMAAWALDEACLLVGRKYENMLNEGKNPFSDLSGPKVEGRRSYASAPKRLIKKVQDVHSIR